MRRLTKINQLPVELNNYLSKPDYFMPIQKNTFLFRQGEAVKDLYVIVSGKILLGKTSSEGRELTLRFCGPNDLIGEFINGELPTNYLVDGKITESGEVAVFNQKKLLEEMSDNPNAMIEFLRFANLQHRKNQTKFRDLLLYGKKGALYSTLIRLSNSYGKKVADGILIDIQLTNQEIANFCATSRESVNRMLNALKQKDIIQMHHGRITIQQLDYLKKEINCENCPAVLCTVN
ncbi:Crp/Fnr family transcriptional regulator [Amphibacillus sp. Q70]|uniref:Crp/Fnr family transcriptional regulator n=1 Tax=Amphibacillus sp. Q70 TaxID=3453416 RepID=UPI003F82924F